MKKIIIISIISLLLFFVLPKIVFTAGQAVVSLNPASQSVNVGSQFSVTLHIDNASGLDNMIAADLLFDSAKISYDHITISDLLNSLGWTFFDPFNPILPCTAPSPDCLNVSLLSDSMSSQAINGNADIVTIYFTANSIGTNQFTYVNNGLYDFGLYSGDSMPATWNPASATIVNNIIISPSSVKAITSFDFITPTTIGVINEGAKTIAITVPYGTALTALAPTIAITGASVNPAAGTAQNFTSPFTYIVTAADDSTQNYIVTVAVAANPAKAITAFNLISPAATGVISGANISLAVPYGFNVTALVPTISITGASVSPLSGAAQNFTNPVTYTVTAADLSTQEYTVTVVVAAPVRLTNIAITTSATKLSYTVGDMLDITGLVVIGIYSDATTKAETITVDNVTGFNGLAPAIGQVLTITVGGKTATYAVNIVAPLSPAKAITAFNFPSGAGVINEISHTIAVNVPNGTDVTGLVATFATTGAGVTIGKTSQVSATTPNNFTTSKIYRVTAVNGTTQDYVVTVTILTAAQTAPGADGAATANSATPKVVVTDPDKAVVVTVADGTDAEIDVSAFIAGGTGTVPQITIKSDDADITIPASTVVDGGVTWNGVIAAPTVTIVILPDVAGQTETLGTAIEVGFTGVKLSFDKAVRILLPGQAGKRAGYVRTGITFTEITNVCTADNQITGDALAADGDCKIDAGSDLVIWTKHFTIFATYTQTAIPAPTLMSTNSDGGGGARSGGAVLPPWPTFYPEPMPISTPTSALITPTVTPQVLAVKISAAEAAVSANEADLVYNYNKFVNLNETTLEFYIFIRKNYAEDLTSQDKYAIAYYIHNGTPTTEKIGADERTSVLNSYLAAFNKLPRSAAEWQDVIKIANGRWPDERQAEAEAVAEKDWFARVYDRRANLKNANDQAAVIVMAYGLRPSPRKLESETAAIQIFEAIFRHHPSSAADWDIARAIAYSGAKR